MEWAAYRSPGDLPGPGIQLGSPSLQVDSLPAELPGKLSEAIYVKFRDNIILNGEKLKENKKTPISKTAQIHPLSSFLFNIIFNVLAITFEEEEKKEFTLEKKKGKNSDFLQMVWCST